MFEVVENKATGPTTRFPHDRPHLDTGLPRTVERCLNDWFEVAAVAVDCGVGDNTSLLESDVGADLVGLFSCSQ